VQTIQSIPLQTGARYGPTIGAYSHHGRRWIEVTRPASQRLSLQMLFMDHSLLTEIYVDCRLQDQDPTMRLLQTLPELQRLGFPLPELLLPVLVERCRQWSTL